MANLATPLKGRKPDRQTDKRLPPSPLTSYLPKEKKKKKKIASSSSLRAKKSIGSAAESVVAVSGVVVSVSLLPPSLPRLTWPEEGT